MPLHPRPSAPRLTAVRLAVAAALAVTSLLAACSSGGKQASAASPGAASSASGATQKGSFSGNVTAPMCGSATTSPPARYQHVIWIWMENHSYGQIIGPAGSTAASRSPYVNGVLKRRCGLAANFHNITHPSLPNYLAAVAGTTGGVRTDCGPTVCPQSATTIFTQVARSGRQWRGYAESMPSRCDLSGTTRYAPRHNPAVYYTGIRTDCRRWDVPMGTTSAGAFRSALAAGTLPAFSFVTPNLCHDTHDCSIATGDTWLKTWVARIVASPAYTKGRTVLFVTWDEGETGDTRNCALNTTDPGCHIPTLVVSRWTRPGTRSGTLFNHYALLRTTEDLLGLPRHLGHAADSTSRSMRSAFHL